MPRYFDSEEWPQEDECEARTGHLPTYTLSMDGHPFTLVCWCGLKVAPSQFAMEVWAGY